MKIRGASKDDATDLARLINLAGEHLPEFLWRQIKPTGGDPLAFGAERAARDEGAFCYRNARIAEIGGEVAGMLLGYRLPDPYDAGDPAELSPILRPLIELEALAPGSWYVNAIAAYERFRGQGVGTRLMLEAEALARAQGTGRLSLIVASENRGASRMYSRLGYAETARRPLETYPGGPGRGAWVLMVKELG
ncbi:MAG: GNAT family N-acetyltransferase [Gammaproteobacteria bacterium]|nr:GNAT family N-acetyltransferase [Gammaproteobacteria bacterium]MDH4255177.1 GNAT family N-acetyltransferase [Gammaproteobacteria bacterium]MDH5310060.1 GNAT family N-acetyltransferase [Gammaproteobacteria bacterium]